MNEIKERNRIWDKFTSLQRETQAAGKKSESLSRSAASQIYPATL